MFSLDWLPKLAERCRTVAAGPRMLPGERTRFTMVAVLLFANSVVTESNEVVATSGFVSQAGADAILLVWAVDMLIVILSAGAYSLVVDRMRRDLLAVRLFLGFSLAYVFIYALIMLGAPHWVSYPLLTILTDQQWMLLPMVVWAMGNDLFSTAEAKKLFPSLAGVAFAGGVFGNGMTASVACWLSQGRLGSVNMLLLNSLLLVVMAGILSNAFRRGRLSITAHQSREGEKVLDSLREGLAFVREVPAFRYLALSMVLLGFGVNVLEYQMIASAAQSYGSITELEEFYALVRAARIGLMVLVQGAAAAWLMEKLGFRSVFGVLPTALMAGLSLAFLWPALLGVVLAEFLSRVTLEGVDDPARRAFLGLVPDERRGRVSAFMDGYLYSTGSIVSCFVMVVILFAVGQGAIGRGAGQSLYFGLAAMGALVSMWSISRFRQHYDESMLNWRLRRRPRGSVLKKLEF